MSMFEYLELGSAPADEPCAQVGSENYSEQAHKETKVYINQLYRVLESMGFTEDKLPPDFSIIRKSNPHDFGTYYEAAVKYRFDNEVSCDIAYELENNLPLKWDEISIQQLKDK